MTMHMTSGLTSYLMNENKVFEVHLENLIFVIIQD